MSYNNHEYSDIHKTLNIPTLKSARIRSDMIYAYKIANLYINCDKLLFNKQTKDGNGQIRVNSYSMKKNG